MVTIRSLGFDLFYFLLSPVWGLALALGLYKTGIFLFHPGEGKMHLAFIFDGILTFGHISLTLFRSHFNSQIASKYKKQLWLYPIILLLLAFASSPILIGTACLLALWDLYHISMQNFGISRIYDRKMGQSDHPLIKWDLAAHLITYILPIIASLEIIEVLSEFHNFDKIGLSGLGKVPWHSQTLLLPLRKSFYGLVTFFLICYGVKYFWEVKKGMAVNKSKLLFMLTTMSVNILAFSLNPLGLAWVIITIYHVAQYYGIVWHSEQSPILERFKISPTLLSTLGVFLLMIISTFALGYFREYHVPYLNDFQMEFSPSRFFLAAFIVLNIFHFYWDGFIWSERKQNVIS